ncbi:MAG: hypothetical protein FJW26_14740 [Acidimicrobiia bacterium]|nr:hypothetical protein [Acidimicrobiia bacterium]
MVLAIRFVSCFLALAAVGTVPRSLAQQKHPASKQSSAKERPAQTKPDLSVDEARMIVKEIPSVDIRATLGVWKLSEAELGQLRQWSGQLVERPGATDFLTQWSQLVRQSSARKPQVKESGITSLIRMVMLAAFEEAEKQLTHTSKTTPSTVFQELAKQIRSNLEEARQLQSLMGFERKDPLSGSRLSLPAHQRTLRKCDVAGEPKRMDCKAVLVPTSYELDDYISASETQLAKAEEEARRGGGASESGQEKRRQILYALSDAAKSMHDAGVVAMRTARR